MIQVRFRHPVTRQRRSVSVATEREAAMVRDRIAGLALALRLGSITDERCLYELRRLSPARRGRRTLRDASAAWIARCAPTTQKGGHSLLDVGPLSTLADVPLEAIDAARLAVWVRVCAGSYKDSSILSAWRVLCAIVRSAISRRWLDVRPWGDWRPPHTLDATPRPRGAATTPDEIARLLAAARELDDNSRQRIADYEARIACAVLLGLRTGELSGLRWSDLDVEGQRVTIARQYDQPAPKCKAATLRAGPELFAILARHRARLAPAGLYAPDGPIFPHLSLSRPGRPRHSPNAVLVSEHVRRVVRLAGLPAPERWTVHSLRASYICVELRASGSVAHAMQRARHSSLKSTQHYVGELLELEPAAPAWSLPPSPPRPPELAP